jgi:ferredoxin-NADP reductase
MASSDHHTETLKVRLTRIDYGAEGINIYRFSSLSGEPLPPFEPGAHIDLYITADISRQYSLLFPAPTPVDYQIAVQHDANGRGGSATLHRQSVVGAIYDISLPRNHFPLGSGEGDHALFAGGIGITPIISMYRKLKADGRPVKLYYWTASADRTLFRKELTAAEASDVVIFHTGGDAPTPPRLSAVLSGIPDDADLYCCGPERMLDEFDQMTTRRPAEKVHREHFSPRADKLAPGDAFRVFLKRSQKTLMVDTEQTLLQACLEADVDASYSCEEGVCGACEVKVLAGKVIHRDSVLSPEQRAKSEVMMICCSRGVGDELVLDI